MTKPVSHMSVDELIQEVTRLRSLLGEKPPSPMAHLVTASHDEAVLVHDRGKIIEANPLAEYLLKAEPGSLVGDHIPLLISSPERGGCEDNRVMASWRCKDGGVLTTENHESVVEIEGRRFQVIRFRNTPTSAVSDQIFDLVHQLPCGFHSLDHEGYVVQMNQTELEWLGYERRDLIGSWFCDFLSANSVNVMQQGLSQLETMDDVEMEVEMVGRNSATFPALIFARALRDKAGHLVRSFMAVLNISKRREVMARLRVSEEKFRGMAEHALFGIILYQNGGFTYVNPGFESISGYPLEEIAGWSQEQFFSLFSGDYRDQLRDEWDPSDCSRFRLLKESLPIHCKDGARRWVSLNLARLSLDGAPSILCSLVDITATHQAEEKERVNLAETIRCQKAIVEIATHETMSKGREVSFRIITEITARTLNVARISIWFWDEAHENLVCHDLYITVADRHEPGMVISMKDFPAYFEAIESGRAIAAHNAHTHESTFEFSESYLKPLGINSMLDAPIRKGGNLIGVICLEHIGPFRQWQQREITFAGEVADQVSQALLNDERAEAVAAMQAAEAKVRKLNADLESKVEERTDALKAAQAELLEKAHQSGMADIATSVIHNIGNALNSLLVSSKLILDNASRRDYRSLEKANALLETLIDKNHPKADELIRYYQALYKVINEECRDLQDNAKRAYQQIHYIREVVEAQEDYANAESHALLLDLPEIIEDSLKLVGHSLMREEILIHKNFGEGLPPVHAVKCKVLHVLVQVVKNAVESLHMVEDRCLYLDLIRSDGNLILKVKDTGAGFPVEDNKRIFAQGYTTKEGYSGFGLHSCANAMTEMGGSICGESEGLGQGAEFFLTFPLK